MGIKQVLKNIFLIGGFFILSLSLVFPPNISAESQQEIINKVVTIAEQREALETEIDGFTKQQIFLEEQINATNAQITENQKKIIETKEKLESEQKKLSEYMRVVYEDEQMSFFEKIFKAKTFSDFVDRSEYLKIYKEHFNESVVNVRELKSELQHEQKKLGEAMIQNQLAKAALDKQKAEREKILAEITEEEKRIRNRFAERLAKFGNISTCKKDGHLIKAKYSIFSFPTDCGYITQGFGNTEFASIDKAYGGAIHNGVDVGVNTGTPIIAIGSGEVFAKGTSPAGGWGNWVMIKHEKTKIENSEVQFYSLYGHLVTESHLKVGEKVTSVSVLGLAGGTPYWDPHLHFSLFVSDSGWSDGKFGPYPGNVVDPLIYMDIPISTVGTDWDPQFAH